MAPTISIRQLRERIKQLPPGRRYNDGKVWYKTQQEHWLAWLNQYHTPGAYNRTVDTSRDAKYSYNHIMCPGMLLYLARQAKVSRRLLREAVAVSNRSIPQAQIVAEIRRLIPWSTIADRLWPKGPNRRMVALSVKEPYATRIVNGTKRVENRTRPTTKRRRVYIYKTAEKKQPGMIIGSVEITGCTKVADDHYKWHLDNAIAFKRPRKVDSRRHPSPNFWYP